MNTTNSIFGSSFKCPCGKVHDIQPGHVAFHDDAVAQLPGFIPPPPLRIAVICDERTRAAAGLEACEVLRAAGYAVAEIVLESPAGRWPICDELTHAWIAGRLDNPQMLLACGSGVISDLAKWVAGDLGLPYVCLATAASMNGYTSANVAPTIGGVKSLLRSRPAAAVVSTPGVLKSAPYEMTAAGLGDVLAKSVSSADWLMNSRLFGDYYCAQAVGLIAQIEPLYLECPKALRAGDASATEALFQALLLTGAAMTMAESSAPASGGEHMISHTLDMMDSLDGAGHDLHGRQVGVGTVIASELYRRLLAIERPVFREPPAVDAKFWGALAPSIQQEYAKKLPRLAQVAKSLSTGDAWENLRAELSAMVRPSEVIRDCLRDAGAAWRPADIGCDAARVRTALLHAHEIRSRVTVLDLAWMTGIMPAAAEVVV